MWDARVEVGHDPMREAVDGARGMLMAPGRGTTVLIARDRPKGAQEVEIRGGLARTLLVALARRSSETVSADTLIKVR